MSVQPGPTFKRYAANGIAPTYTITFLLLDADDLQITLDGVPITSGFTLAGIGNPTSSCTFTVPPLGDLLFQQVMTFQRLADYQTNGDFLAGTVNRDYDRLWLAVKQLFRDNGRALTAPLLEPEGIPSLPVIASRALRLLAFDALGQPTPSNLTLDQIEQQPALALESAAAAALSAASANASKLAAAASALAAAISAANALTSEGNAAATLATAQKQIQEITATVAANALTLGWIKTPTSFRAPSLTSGVINNRNPPSNLSLVVPSGATLGTANGVLSRLVLLEIDNAGTVELAVVNLAGGVNLDETTLINTTAIGAGSNAANVIYSAAARAGVPFRVAGIVASTQAAAGVWVTPPSIVQGAGGQAIAAFSSLGYGQTQQNVIGSRVAGTTYINTTGRPIFVKVSGRSNSTNCLMTLTVDGVIVSESYYLLSAGSSQGGSAVFDVVPPGSSYRIDVTSYTISLWTELR